jgi:hypothetical protein
MFSPAAIIYYKVENMLDYAKIFMLQGRRIVADSSRQERRKNGVIRSAERCELNFGANRA